VQKFSSHTRSKLLRVLVRARLRAAVHREHGEGSQQKGDWRNSVWHLFRISLTID
jgi:hypothetical protein